MNFFCRVKKFYFVDFQQTINNLQKIQQLTMNKIDSVKINNLFNEPYFQDGNKENICTSKQKPTTNQPLPPTPPPTPQLFCKNN